MDNICIGIKSKNDSYSWGLCMEWMWSGWHFAIANRHEEITRYFWMRHTLYVLSSNGNACILLTFKKFWLVLLIQMP